MIEIITAICLLTGLVFFLGTSVGVLRFKDFYMRAHAAAKGDTASSLLILIGFALYNMRHFDTASVLVSCKIMFIVIFLAISSPTATHALINAGFVRNIAPWAKPKEGVEE